MGAGVEAEEQDWQGSGNADGEGGEESLLDDEKESDGGNQKGSLIANRTEEGRAEQGYGRGARAVEAGQSRGGEQESGESVQEVFHGHKGHGDHGDDYDECAEDVSGVPVGGDTCLLHGSPGKPEQRDADENLCDEGNDYDGTDDLIDCCEQKRPKDGRRRGGEFVTGDAEESVRSQIFG